MNLQIEVSANLERKLQERAQQAGVSIETFVLQVVSEHLAETEAPAKRMDPEEFSLWLRHWAERFPKLDQVVDDSRESFYR